MTPRSDGLQSGPLKDVLTRSEPDAATVDRVWEQLRAVEPRRRVRSARLAAAAVVLAVVTSGAMVWRASAAATGLQVGDVALDQVLAQPHDVAQELALSDGSVLSLDRGASMRALANEGDHVTLALQQGRVGFDVKPGGPRRWTIQANDVRVEVLGTAFVVDVKAAGVSVSVTRGVVEVWGERVPNGHRRLFAGDSFSSQPEPQRAPEPVRWLALAERGDMTKAATVLGPAGLASEAKEPLTSSQRLLLADVAAAGGDLALSEKLLAEVMLTSTERSEQALAAYKRGLRLQENLGEPTRGAESLERAMELGLPSSLRRDACLRTAQAWMQAGDTSRARRWLERAERDIATP